MFIHSMKHKKRFKVLNVYIAAGVLLILTACGNPRETSNNVLSSCLITPNVDLTISVGQFVELMKSKGGSIAWESEDDTHILRSSITDRLTGESQSFDVEFVVRPATASEKPSPNCGPDRAVVSRALMTANGLVESDELDFLMIGVAEQIPSSSSSFKRVPTLPPERVQGHHDNNQSHTPSLDDLGT